jgi:hypothetical protein
VVGFLYTIADCYDLVIFRRSHSSSGAETSSHCVELVPGVGNALDFGPSSRAKYFSTGVELVRGAGNALSLGPSSWSMLASSLRYAANRAAAVP